MKSKLNIFLSTDINVGFTFWIFFLLQLASNLTWELVTPSWLSCIFIVFLSALIAGIFTLPIQFMVQAKAKLLAYIYVPIILLSFAILIVIDYFLWVNFSQILIQDIVDIIYETNPKESSEFLTTYLSLKQCCIYILSLSFYITLSWIIAKFISRYKFSTYVAYGLIMGGVFIVGFSGYSFIKYRNGYSIPQYSTLTRLIHASYILESRVAENNTIIENCKELLLTPYSSMPNDSLIAVLVIGESHSYFHTPSYGYEKNTMPLISRHTQSLIWLKDVVAVSDHTHGVMTSLFEHYLPKSNKLIVFPAAFKHLGFVTSMYDNQYLPGQGINFINDYRLSNLVFNNRNKHSVSDENLIKMGQSEMTERQLIIYHLFGSHYTYETRYPYDRFGKFRANQYDKKHSIEQREILAHYDNSLLYTDFVLNSLITDLANKNAVVVYVSDHGEEVFDIDEYMGHGNSSMRSDKSFQLRVPMFVWMSKKYIKTYPQKYNQILANVLKPFITSNLSNLMLDLVEAPPYLYIPSKSIANKSFTPQKRIVLHSVDFDKK